MKLRILTLLVLLTILVGLAACGTPAAADVAAPTIPTELFWEGPIPFDSDSDSIYQENVHLFDYDQQAPLEIQEVENWRDGDATMYDITYASPKVGPVPATLIVPDGAGSFAGVVVQHDMPSDIVEVISDGPEAAEARDYLAMDEALRNVAELGLGYNDHPAVTGNVLEDEKVMGTHWAFVRSDHLGGTVGVEESIAPDHVEHRDGVYPTGGAIEIASLVLEYEDGKSEEIIKDGEYTLFYTSERSRVRVVPA